MTRSSRLARFGPWLAPVGVAAVVAAIAVVPANAFGSGRTKLPARSVEQLMTFMQQRDTHALSGTLVETASLGLPSLPSSGASSLSWQSLIVGSHTIRVWIDGGQKQRFALLGTLSEADVIHSGNQLWSYTSQTQAVTHETLKSDDTDPMPLAEASMPATEAQQLISELSPSTTVTVGANTTVAGRSAYTLVLQPKDARSTVSKVVVAIDGATGVPTKVSIYGAGSSPAFQTGFTDISFSTPAASIFDFTPPAGSTVTQGSPFAIDGQERFTERAAPGQHATTRIVRSGSKAIQLGSLPGGQLLTGGDMHATKELGKDWTTVVELGDLGELGPVFSELSTPQSDGDRLIQTALLNALVLPDGTSFVGAVTPAYLEQVAKAATR